MPKLSLKLVNAHKEYIKWSAEQNELIYYDFGEKIEYSYKISAYLIFLKETKKIEY